MAGFGSEARQKDERGGLVLSLHVVVLLSGYLQCYNSSETSLAASRPSLSTAAGYKNRELQQNPGRPLHFVGHPNLDIGCIPQLLYEDLEQTALTNRFSSKKPHHHDVNSDVDT
jgi:hypothetical protein